MLFSFTVTSMYNLYEGETQGEMAVMFKHKLISFSHLWHKTHYGNYHLHNFILRFSRVRVGEENAYQEVIMITVLVRATLEWDCSLPSSKSSTFPLCPHLASPPCFLVLVLLLEQVPCVQFSTRGVNSPLSRSEQCSLWQSHRLLLTLTDPSRLWM